LNFPDLLEERWRETGSLLCVGLDPERAKLPVHLRQRPDALFEFCREIADATASWACAFKPQAAYFAAEGAEDALARLIEHLRERHPRVPVILDAKRGDIGATARQYAREAFERYGAHAVTLSPYMGGDSIEPFLEHPGRGVFLLCRTSNPGGDDLQMLDAGGERVFERVARLAAGAWSGADRAGRVGLVVGATYPQELARVRELAPGLPLLVPGIGAQGGDLAAASAAGCRRDGAGILLNSSRAILYAGSGTDFAAAAETAAKETFEQIRALRPSAGARG